MLAYEHHRNFVSSAYFYCEALDPSAILANLRTLSKRVHVLGYSCADLGKLYVLCRDTVRRHFRMQSSRKDMEPSSSGYLRQCQYDVYHNRSLECFLGLFNLNLTNPSDLALANAIEEKVASFSSLCDGSLVSDNSFAAVGSGKTDCS